MTLHELLIVSLTRKLPDGVPQDPDVTELWPITWGEIEDGKVVRWGETGESCCLQCLFCKHYHELRGRLGADWGLCANAKSEYFRQGVFEHWTCRFFEVRGR